MYENNSEQMQNIVNAIENNRYLKFFIALILVEKYYFELINYKIYNFFLFIKRRIK